MKSNELDKNDLIRLLEFGATHSSFTLDEARCEVPSLNGYLGKPSTSEMLETIDHSGTRYRLTWKALAVYANVAAVRETRRHADAAESSAKQAANLACIAIVLAFIVGLAQIIVTLRSVRSLPLESTSPLNSYDESSRGDYSPQESDK